MIVFNIKFMLHNIQKTKEYKRVTNLKTTSLSLLILLHFMTLHSVKQILNCHFLL